MWMVRSSLFDVSTDAGDALLLGLVGHGLGHDLGHRLVQNGGDDVLGGELIGRDQIGQRVGGPDLHALGDVGGPDHQGSLEYAGEDQHVVDLVGEVAAAGAHHRRAAPFGLVGHDLGHGVGHGEDNALVHGAHHLGGDQAGPGHAHKGVGPFQRVGQGAVLMVPVGDMGDLLLAGIESCVALTDDAVDVAHHHVAEAHLDEQLADGDAGGAGAAGIAIGKLLIQMGFGNVVMCDIHGIICEGDAGLNPGQEEISHISNRNHEHGTLADALKGADAFVGVSRPGLVTAEMVGTMNQGIVFPMANPVPEIMPDEAKRGGAAVVGTGRSDFPNQINNVLVFPGVFKGALMVRATDITEGMKIRAAHALADLIPADQLSPEYIIPSVLDKSVAEVVAKAVADEAKEQGIARIR